MTEQDVMDEGADLPELPELRELHRQDRMPGDVRERLMHRLRRPRAEAQTDAGLREVERGGDGDGRFAGDGDAGGGDVGDGVVGDGDVDGVQQPLASPRWAPSLVGGAEGEGVPGAHRRRLAWGLGAAGLGAAGLAAAAVALYVGVPASRMDVELREEAADAPSAVSDAQRSRSDRSLASESAGGASSPGRSTLKELTVVGWLEPGSVKRLPVPGTAEPGACRFGFRLRPLAVDSNAALRIEYARCRIPDALTASNGGCVKVTAEGRRAADGHLEAKRVVAQFVQCQP
jgi:hypothetical protein